MTGLVTKNGTLAEGYTYDAYGKVNAWGYPPMDFNRDGDVDNDDLAEFTSADASSDPAVDPKADADGDGDVDGADYSYFQAVATSPGVEPATLFTSGLGNQHFFTGRRLYFIETLHDNPDPINPQLNWQVQYSRARHYCPIHGRWLQRDPLGYIDAMNLYEYVQSNPVRFFDPNGLRKISFRFAAFIGSTFPLWNDEPWGILYEFAKDGRTWGASGSSRLATIGEVESTKIGKLSGVRSGYTITDTWTSYRRNKLTGTISQAKSIPRKYVHLRNNHRKCLSEYTITAAARYPFRAYAPDIDYFIKIRFKVIKKGKILAVMSGGHDPFPDYDGIVDGILGYKYSTPFKGPRLSNLSTQLSSGIQFSSRWIINAPTPPCCPQ